MANTALKKRVSTHDKVEISWKYVEASRLQGYKYWTALADLVDNSIDANSSEIKIILDGRIKSQVDRIMIIDNGCGMDGHTLKESYNLGARTDHPRTDLGKFGVGGTLGSIALGKTKYTFTRSTLDQGIIARKLSLDECRTKDSFFSSEYVPTPEEIRIFDNYIGEKSTGTLIVLEDLDKMIGKSVPVLKAKILKHFGETYYQHLQGNLEIFVNGSIVESRDPICWFHNKTKKMKDEKVEYEGVVYNVKCANLIDVPREDISGHLEHSQGIYSERNERLILKACANGDYFEGFWNKSPRHRFFRAMISFDSSADEQMGITTDKSKINISDQALMDKFRSVINPCAKIAHDEARAKEKSSTKDDRKSSLIDTEAVMNKSIIVPKQKKQRSKTPITLDSVENDIEPIIQIRDGKTENSRYKVLEVSEGQRGSLARLEGHDIKINIDHYYLSKYYVGASEEARKGVLAWITSLVFSEVEIGSYSQDDANCSMEDFFDRFEKRLAAFCRAS
jgi:hypothetical protein